VDTRRRTGRALEPRVAYTRHDPDSVHRLCRPNAQRTLCDRARTAPERAVRFAISGLRSVRHVTAIVYVYARDVPESYLSRGCAGRKRETLYNAAATVTASLRRLSLAAVRASVVWKMVSSRGPVPVIEKAEVSRERRFRREQGQVWGIPIRRRLELGSSNGTTDFSCTPE